MDFQLSILLSHRTQSILLIPKTELSFCSTANIAYIGCSTEIVILARNSENSVVITFPQV